MTAPRIVFAATVILGVMTVAGGARVLATRAIDLSLEILSLGML